MGVLKKIGFAILAYVILGVVFTILLLNDIININDGNVVIEILHTIFYPIIIPANFIIVTLPFP